MRRLFLLLTLQVLAVPLALSAGEPDLGAIKAAISKAIPVMETAIKGHSTQRDCFSCHHHAMGAMVTTLAKDRGFSIDPAIFSDDVEYGENMLKGGMGILKQGKPIGGGVTTVGYTLMALELGKHQPNEVTTAAVTYLLKSPQNGDHWKAMSVRVPSEGSEFTASYLALRGLKAFGQPSDREKIEALNQKVKTWLIEHKGNDTEDRVFRLKALHLLKAEQPHIQSSVDILIKTQRPDGGWAQLDQGAESDAYATGTALVALSQSGGIRTSDPAYQKGLAYLLKTQKPDGTWYVKSRTKVIVQKFFESGFPHGKDQFISIAATGWSTAALLLAVPEKK
jgi:transposase-like protein